jgi:hypothetical protein
VVQKPYNADCEVKSKVLKWYIQGGILWIKVVQKPYNENCEVKGKVVKWYIQVGILWINQPRNSPV